MRTQTRLIAAIELALILPAALFMCAVLVRNLQPLQYEPAHTAQRIVMWYADRVWTLWLLLVSLPLTVLVTGGATLLRGWSRNEDLPHVGRQASALMHLPLSTLFVAATTLTAGGILVIVVLHMLAN